MNADAAQMNVLQERVRRVPDLMVEDSIVVEIKAIVSVERVHRQQCLNYLRASNLRLGLLLNFGRAHLEVGRVVNHF